MESTYGSLYLPYKDNYWFWECVEMWRKMILTGGMVLVAPGSSAQVLLAEVVCLIYLLLVLKIAPFRYDLDDWLAFAASLQLFLVFMAAFALKTDDPNDTVYEARLMGICLSILCCGILILGAGVLGSLVYTNFNNSDGNTNRNESYGKHKIAPTNGIRIKKHSINVVSPASNRSARQKKRGGNSTTGISKNAKASRFWSQQV
eukprot:g3134.t1